MLAPVKIFTCIYRYQPLIELRDSTRQCWYPVREMYQRLDAGLYTIFSLLTLMNWLQIWITVLELVPAFLNWYKGQMLSLMVFYVFIMRGQLKC